MEKERIDLWNKFVKDAQDNGVYDVKGGFKEKYKDFPSWDGINFSSQDTAKQIWGKSLKGIIQPIDFKKFLSTYACDLDWAKNEEYCKVAPKQDQWVALEEENKTEFLERYPCIASLIKGKGRQKMTSDGMVFILPIVTEGKSCWVYMLDDPDKSSKYNGRIVNMANQEDVGKFECEGNVVSGDENLPKD